MTRGAHVHSRLLIRGDPNGVFRFDGAQANPHRMSSGSSIFHVARKVEDHSMVMINIMTVPDQHPIHDLMFTSQDSVHPNILSFTEYYQDLGAQKWLVLDYMQGEWLNNVVARTSLEEDHIARITAETCKGLDFLHDLGLILRTVKMDGIFLTRAGEVKLCDFQHIIKLGVVLRKGMSYKLVAPHWMPPEVAQSHDYTLRTDTWSLGIMVIEMLEKVPPHFHEVPKDVLRQLKTGSIPTLSTVSANKSSSGLHDFLKQTFCIDSRKRPHVKDLLTHPFLESACQSSDLIPLLRHKFRPVSNTGPKNLTGQVIRQSTFATVHGGFSDVYLGTYEVSDSSGAKQKPIPVAIKVLRSITPDLELHQKIQKRLNRELSVWNILRHPNIVELLGICSDMGPHSGMVSPWYSKGSAPQYLKSLGKDGTLYVRLRLLTEVAAGLEYLHRFTPTVVHGDMKGANILISAGGEACLCDFGLSTILSEVAGSSNFTSTFAGSLRWTAPELIRPNEESGEAHHITTWSDIYALGSVTYELLTGLVPYHIRKTDVQVMFDVIKGIFPKRPSAAEAAVPISDAHWSFIQSCWRENPLERPPISVAGPALEAMYCEVLLP